MPSVLIYKQKAIFNTILIYVNADAVKQKWLPLLIKTKITATLDRRKGSFTHGFYPQLKSRPFQFLSIYRTIPV